MHKNTPVLVIIAALLSFAEIPAAPSPLWEFKSSADFISPQVLGSKIFVVRSGSSKSEILAINASDGKSIWTHAIDDGFDLASIPCYTEDRVYYFSRRSADTEGAQETRLILLNAANGSLIKSTVLPTRDFTVHSPFVLDGILYFVTYPSNENFYEANHHPPGGVSAYNLETGSLIWKTTIRLKHANDTDLQELTLKTRNTNAWIVRPEKIAADQGSLYFGYPNGKVYSVIRKDGRISWEFHTRDRFTVSPVLRNGTLYFGSGDWNFYALSASQGKLKWKLSTGADAGHSEALFHEGSIFFSSGEYQLLPAGSIVMITNQDANQYTDHTTNSVLAVDAATGRQIWRYNTKAVSYRPILNGKNIRILDSRGEIADLDISSGSVVRVEQLKTIIRSALPAGDSILIHTGNNPFFRRGGFYRDMFDGGARLDRLFLVKLP